MAGTARHPWKKALRILGWILGTPLAVLSLALYLLSVGVASPVATRVLGILNRQFKGRLEADHTEVYPNGKVVLRGARIFDPDGALVVEVESLITFINLPGLAQKKVELHAPVLKGVTVDLATNAAGELNIARAFEPRHPGPPAPPQPGAAGGGWLVSIEPIQIDASRLRFAINGQPRPFAELDGAQVSGSFSLDRDNRIDIAASIDPATLTGPIPGPAGGLPAGPLQLKGHLSLGGSRLQATVALHADDDALEAIVDLDLATLSGSIDVPRLSVGPHVLAAFLPRLEPRGVSGQLHASLTQGLLHLTTAEFGAPSGPSKISVKGDLDLRHGNGQASLSVAHVDGHALLGTLPQTDLNLAGRGQFSALFTDARQARGQVDLGVSYWDKDFIGPGHFDAAHVGPRSTLRNLSISLPGAHLKGTAQLVGHAVAADLALEAPRLDLLRSAIERVAGVKLPDFAGDLGGTVHLGGALADLSLAADLHSGQVELNGLQANQLTAHLEAPRLGRHIDLHGQVLVGCLQAGPEQLRKLDLTVDWTTPTLTLLASLEESHKAVVVWTRLTLPADLESATVEELELSLPTGEWRLANPSRADFSHGFEIHGLALSSGDQRAGLQLSAGPGGLRLRGDVENVDLALVPRALLGGKPLRGRIDASVDYRQAGALRTASADLRLSHFAYDQLRISEAHLIAALGPDHLKATLTALADKGAIDLGFDGPLPWRSGALDGDLQLHDFQIGDLQHVLPQLADYSGTLEISASLGGTWAAPHLRLHAGTNPLIGPWTRVGGADAVGPLDVAVDAELADSRTTLRLFLKDLDRPGPPLLSVDASAELGSRQLAVLLHKPAQLAPAVLGAPFEASVNSGTLDLTTLAASIPQLAAATSLRGSAVVTAKVSGTLRTPRGDVDLQLHKVSWNGRQLGTIHVLASAHDEGLGLHTTLTTEGAGEASVNAQWRLPPEALGDRRRRQQALGRVDVSTKDLSLSVLLGERSLLSGHLQLEGSASGSLERPLAKLTLQLPDLGVSGRPAGRLTTNASWDGHELRAALGLLDARSNALEAHAALPLTSSGIGQGPLDGALDSTHFDLSILNGPLVESGALRNLAGRLDAHLRLRGTRADPIPSGSLVLTGGDLALKGLGDFQRIGFSAQLSRDRLTVDQLTLSSGGGPLTGHLDAARSGEGVSLTGQLQIKRFGVFVADQLRAFVTAAVSLSGTLAKRGSAIEIGVSKGSIRIPDLTQRALGEVSLDPDIVIGKPQPKIAPGPASKAYPIAIHVSAPGPIEVTGPDLDLAANADLRIRLAHDVTLSGLIAVTEGQVNASGRTFKVNHARLSFGDGADHFAPPLQAALDARASQEVEGYKVSIVIAGKLSDPIPELSSDPPLPQRQIAQLLVSGGAGTGQDLGYSLVGGLLSEQIKDALGSNLPLDVLTLEPNRLEAGKRLTRRLYIGVIENPTNIDPRVNGQEIHGRYDLGRRFDIDGRYGTANAGSLDLQWSHNW